MANNNVHTGFFLPLSCFITIIAMACITREPPPAHSPAHDCPESQRCPDLGNGRFLNPILGGDYPDPSVLRVGDDYYMTHSSFEYVPGLLIWHSRDLVNWRPICHALNEYVGSVFAPDLIRHDSLFYIYFPVVKYEGDRMAGISNAVVTASSPEGTWSSVTGLNVGHIDPGHVSDEAGRRYLHLSEGYMVDLAPDGRSVTGDPRKVYGGWAYPDTFNVEGFCLEAPKLTKRNGYYYLTSAEGGTAGPATSHMIVSARSESPRGPWENSPYNPIVHTGSATETWWSKGHGTLVSTTDEMWWIMYHGYENGYYNLGRQTLLEPVEWLEDGWFRIPEGIMTDRPMAKPAGENGGHGLALSDDFSGSRLGLQWRFYREFDTSRFSLPGHALILEGRGNSPADCGPLVAIPTNHAYEIQAEFGISDAAVGGLVLFYSPEAFTGIGMAAAGLVKYERGKEQPWEELVIGRHAWLSIRNDHHQVSFFYSTDGKDWKRYPSGAEVSGYHHNAFGHFLSLRAGIFAAGEGKVTCKDFRYIGLD